MNQAGTTCTVHAYSRTVQSGFASGRNFERLASSCEKHALREFYKKKKVFFWYYVFFVLGLEKIRRIIINYKLK